MQFLQFGRAAAAGRDAIAERAGPYIGAARAVNRRLAIGVEGFPFDALRVGDPLLVRSRIAAGCRLLLDDRALGFGEAAVDLGQFTLIFGLDTEMRNPRAAPARRADREIDPRGNFLIRTDRKSKRLDSTHPK